MKAVVGERAAEPFVKEQEEQGDLNPFWGETVGVAGSVTLQQPVGFELDAKPRHSIPRKQSLIKPTPSHATFCLGGGAGAKNLRPS